MDSHTVDIMPKCCACNSSGLCKLCVCVRLKRRCLNCAPSQHNRCCNLTLPGTHATPVAKTVASAKLPTRGSTTGKRYKSSSSPASSFSSAVVSSSSAVVSSSSCPPSLPDTPDADTGLGAGANISPSLPDTPDLRNAERIGDRTRACTAGADVASTGSPDVRNHQHVTLSKCELPPFQHAASPTFRWASIEGNNFVQQVHQAYDETMHWRRNIFSVPSGKNGRAFVQELTRLFEAFAQPSALEIISIEAAMLACTLLLQKPHAKSKTKEHDQALERRLHAWGNGDIAGLLREGRTIQTFLCENRGRYQESEENRSAKIFANLMTNGRVPAAIRMLSDQKNAGVLSLEADAGSGKSVREVLKEKHPQPRPVAEEALLSIESKEDVHPVLYESVNGELIRSMILRTQGAAGPSGIDANGWRRLCTSFHRESKELCEAIAGVARRLCTSYVDPACLRAFTACRLIPIDKNPGVRPIGICEIIRRVIGKAILRVIKTKVISAAGPLQLCTGQRVGCESAIRAMRSVFDSDENDAIILVDAANAFNNLNRKVALFNIQRLCPSIAKVLTNCYRQDSLLFAGGEVLLSQEGLTQGDPLAMAMFGLATGPLIEKVSTRHTTQVWFADDAADGGPIRAIREWWDKLVRYGPSFGYFPNAEKTAVVVKACKLEEAVQEFQGTGVSLTVDGKRYLGGAVGSEAFVEATLRDKVASFKAEVETLSRFANSQPQAALAAFTHGLSSKWTFLSRAMSFSKEVFEPLEKAIRCTFIPALTLQPAPNDQMRAILSLPASKGGLAIVDPQVLAMEQDHVSARLCQPVVENILRQKGDALKAFHAQSALKQNLRRESRQAKMEAITSLVSELPSTFRRTVSTAQEKGASAWVTALPKEEHGFSLHKGEFHDALCLRYGWPLRYTPSTCACGAQFSPDHALICRYGGFVTLRHNEVRDLTADLLREVVKNVAIEPQLLPISNEILPPSSNKDDNARSDIRASGFWGGSSNDAFFDIRVVHPFAPCYSRTEPHQVYRQHEQRKKLEYGRRIQEIDHGSFTPLVMSTTGGMGNEATVFFKRLASLLAEKRGEEYSKVMGWLRCRLSFCLLRSTIRCIRGSRTKRTKFNNENLSVAIAEANLTVDE